MLCLNRYLTSCKCRPVHRSQCIKKFIQRIQNAYEPNTQIEKPKTIAVVPFLFNHISLEPALVIRFLIWHPARVRMEYAEELTGRAVEVVGFFGCTMCGASSWKVCQGQIQCS